MMWGRNTYSSSTSSSISFLFLAGLKDPRSNSASKVLPEGEGDGVRYRLDEEEAVAFLFATAAFTTSVAAAAFIALVSRTSCSWGGCRCVTYRAGPAH